MLLTMTMMLCCLGMASAAVCNGGTDPSPKTDTGCRYGACAQPSATSGRCVHDGGECANGEVYVKAVNTQDELNGLVCTCEDILSYPSTIGICDHDGAMTPMAIASDCPTGSTPICDADANGRCASKDALCSLSPRPLRRRVRKLGVRRAPRPLHRRRWLTLRPPARAQVHDR